MRSWQAILRLAGGFTSCLLVACAIRTLLVDVLGFLFARHILVAMHSLAETALLGVGGVSCLLSEIRPHPVVNETAPFLTHLGGRALFYLFMGMHLTGRTTGRTGAFDSAVGLVTLGISFVSMIAAHRSNQCVPSRDERLRDERLRGESFREMDVVRVVEVPVMMPLSASGSLPERMSSASSGSAVP
mmetsp:Transcript_51088/g.136295  ORF Transcript_51088/g.136295 Transcript_51088/m.136295 type:complete len:187 (-) Transcript_51088:151-711(-)